EESRQEINCPHGAGSYTQRSINSKATVHHLLESPFENDKSHPHEVHRFPLENFGSHGSVGSAVHFRHGRGSHRPAHGSRNRWIRVQEAVCVFALHGYGCGGISPG